MFTDPPLARVGLSEGEARRQGIETRAAKLPTSAVLRTHTIDETQGFMKALIAARDDRILGFTMIGAEAGEVVATVQMAMLAGRPYISYASNHGGRTGAPLLECSAATFVKRCTTAASSSV